MKPFKFKSHDIKLQKKKGKENNNMKGYLYILFVLLNTHKKTNFLLGTQTHTLFNHRTELAVYTNRNENKKYNLKGQSFSFNICLLFSINQFSLGGFQFETLVNNLISYHV